MCTGFWPTRTLKLLCREMRPPPCKALILKITESILSHLCFVTKHANLLGHQQLKSPLLKLLLQLTGNSLCMDHFFCISIYCINASVSLL